MSRLSRAALFLLVITACLGFGPCQRSTPCDTSRDPLCFSTRPKTKAKH